MLQIALVRYSDGEIDFEPIFHGDDHLWEIAESIIIGRAGNHTGRTPTQEEFEQAWAIMDDAPYCKPY